MPERETVAVYFYFSDTAPAEIYTLSLHDALPILAKDKYQEYFRIIREESERLTALINNIDRKSTRLNSSHITISYAVFCLKKKKDKLKPVGSHEGTDYILLHSDRPNDTAPIHDRT